MRRALSEYEVRGIKTTIPFFQWILATDAFRAGAFDTTTLDRILAERRGQPFVEAPHAAADLAVVATALRTWFRAQRAGTATASTPTPAPSAWRQAARLEGRR
jgi:acetyl-CoA carboxylase biotin carboxylase subunit